MLFVVLHLQDVRVARNEKFWRVQLQLFANPRLVSSWIASDVGDPDIDLLNLEAQVQGKRISDFTSVNIAKNAPENTLLPYLFNDARVSDITGVPNLIRLLTISEYFLVNIPVRIREKQNLSRQIPWIKLVIFAGH